MRLRQLSFILAGLAVFFFVCATECATVEKRSSQYSIEVRVFVDSHALNSWKNKVSQTDADTTDADVKSSITGFIKSSFNDLNSVFKGLSKSGITMDARIESIEFVTDKVSNHDEGKVSSKKILDDFREWLQSANYSTVDHNLLLTGLDLTSGGSSTTAGRASVGTMCDPKYSRSVVEATSTGVTTLVMAHELGHSLNASHDGDGNSCTTGNYIMKASRPGEPQNNQIFRFSSCSVKYFSDFLDSGKGKCLTQTTAAKVSAKPLGQIYDPDQLCQLQNGNQSYVCRNFYGKGKQPYSDICRSVLCKSPGKSYCSSMAAADGFVCGKGKRCSLGDCVTENSVSTVGATDECPLGDSPLPFGHLEGKTCAKATADFPGHCYNQQSRRECCKSCAAAKTTKDGCTYGDHSSWCLTLKSRDCYLNANVCCSACLKFQTAQPDCKYGDKQSWCSTLEPRLCYSNDANCCDRCKKLEKPDLGSDCKYGDKAKGCATMEERHCPSNKKVCCERCKE